MSGVKGEVLGSEITESHPEFRSRNVLKGFLGLMLVVGAPMHWSSMNEGLVSAGIDGGISGLPVWLQIVFNAECIGAVIMTVMFFVLVFRRDAKKQKESIARGKSPMASGWVWLQFVIGVQVIVFGYWMLIYMVNNILIS